MNDLELLGYNLTDDQLVRIIRKSCREVHKDVTTITKSTKELVELASAKVLSALEDLGVPAEVVDTDKMRQFVAVTYEELKDDLNDASNRDMENAKQYKDMSELPLEPAVQMQLSDLSEREGEVAAEAQEAIDLVEEEEARVRERKGASRKTAGLESHVDLVINDKDPELRSTYYWRNGMNVEGGEDAAEKLMEILDDSHEFGKTSYNANTKQIAFGRFSERESSKKTAAITTGEWIRIPAGVYSLYKYHIDDKFPEGCTSEEIGKISLSGGEIGLTGSVVDDDKIEVILYPHEEGESVSLHIIVDRGALIPIKIGQGNLKKEAQDGGSGEGTSHTTQREFHQDDKQRITDKDPISKTKRPKSQSEELAGSDRLSSKRAAMAEDYLAAVDFAERSFFDKGNSWSGIVEDLRKLYTSLTDAQISDIRGELEYRIGQYNIQLESSIKKGAMWESEGALMEEAKKMLFEENKTASEIRRDLTEKYSDLSRKGLESVMNSLRSEVWRKVNELNRLISGSKYLKNIRSSKKRISFVEDFDSWLDENLELLEKEYNQLERCGRQEGAIAIPFTPWAKQRWEYLKEHEQGSSLLASKRTATRIAIETGTDAGGGWYRDLYFHTGSREFEEIMFKRDAMGNIEEEELKFWPFDEANDCDVALLEKVAPDIYKRISGEEAEASKKTAATVREVVDLLSGMSKDNVEDVLIGTVDESYPFENKSKYEIIGYIRKKISDGDISADKVYAEAMKFRAPKSQYIEHYIVEFENLIDSGYDEDEAYLILVRKLDEQDAPITYTDFADALHDRGLLEPGWERGWDAYVYLRKLRQRIGSNLKMKEVVEAALKRCAGWHGGFEPGTTYSISCWDEGNNKIETYSNNPYTFNTRIEAEKEARKLADQCNADHVVISKDKNGLTVYEWYRNKPVEAAVNNKKYWWVAVSLDAHPEKKILIPLSSERRADDLIHSLETSSDITVFAVDNWGEMTEQEIKGKVEGEVGSENMSVVTIYNKLLGMVKAAKKTAVRKTVFDAGVLDVFEQKVKDLQKEAWEYFGKVNIVPDEEDILGYVMDALEEEAGVGPGTIDEKSVKKILLGSKVTASARDEFINFIADVEDVEDPKGDPKHYKKIDSVLRKYLGAGFDWDSYVSTGGGRSTAMNLLEALDEKGANIADVVRDLKAAVPVTAAASGLSDLEKQVKEGTATFPDHIVVDGVDYVMVEYSMATSDYGEKPGQVSKYITYADEDTLKTEININTQDRIVERGQAMVDWTAKGYQPRKRTAAGVDDFYDEQGKAKYQYMGISERMPIHYQKAKEFYKAGDTFNAGQHARKYLSFAPEGYGKPEEVKEMEEIRDACMSAEASSKKLAAEQSFEFGLEDADNIRKAKEAIKGVGIPYTITYGGGITYFMFNNKADVDKATRLISRDVIDTAKESEEWHSTKRAAVKEEPLTKGLEDFIIQLGQTVDKSIYSNAMKKHWTMSDAQKLNELRKLYNVVAGDEDKSNEMEDVIQRVRELVKTAAVPDLHEKYRKLGYDMADGTAGTKWMRFDGDTGGEEPFKFAKDWTDTEQWEHEVGNNILEDLKLNPATQFTEEQIDSYIELEDAWVEGYEELINKYLRERKERAAAKDVPTDKTILKDDKGRVAEVDAAGRVEVKRGEDVIYRNWFDNKQVAIFELESAGFYKPEEEDINK